MLDIYEYIKRPKAERQSHLQLTDPCIDRGGATTYSSFQCRALLAHVLDTTLPVGGKIHLCHACKTKRCSNPYHLYWGSASENHLDRMANGDFNLYQYMVKKYGKDQTTKIYSKNATGRTQSKDTVRKRVAGWKRTRASRKKAKLSEVNNVCPPLSTQ